VGSPRSRSNLETSRRLNVNFQVARHRIEALSHYPKMIRARALAAYVGVFDFADEHGVVDASSEEIAAEFEIGRPSWLHYRALLEEAGLVEVDPLQGGRRRGFRLLPPSASDIGLQRAGRKKPLP
jgi:hypothetical protein